MGRSVGRDPKALIRRYSMPAIKKTPEFSGRVRGNSKQDAMGTPTQLGKYALDATPLGEGAMGVVYKGYDPDLRQAVAIKVIRGELLEGSSGEQMRQRFKNEAIAGRRLRHPNIVPVYEYGEDEDCSYIVMAFVDGRPLKDELDTGPRSSVSEALAITGQLLAALQHAHRNNVVHRDIKPANILVGEDGQLQVADFGIAKIDLANLTRTGQILGTPAYMSPEQCDAMSPDHRADIFSAGVILYQLLTGEQPFRASSVFAVMQQVRTLDPVRPSQLNPDASPALDAVVAKAMAKRREERFQSAREFADALKAAAKPQPAPAKDVRAMPTITDTVLDGRDQAPPRTPSEVAPKTASENPLKTPSNKESPTRSSRLAVAVPAANHHRPLFRPGSARRSWLAVAVSAVAAAGVLVFLVGKNDVPPKGDSAARAGNNGVSAPPDKTDASESTDDRAPTRDPPVKPVFERSPDTVFRDRLADGTEGPEMVVVPAGRFLMGSPNSDKDAEVDEQPQHEVTISKPYAMGRYEVTFEEYDRFAEATGRKLPADFGWGRGKRPVIFVAFKDARAYAGWLSKETGESYRLPSEAE